MPRIVCHPDNWNEVKKMLDSGKFDDSRNLWQTFHVTTNPEMDRDKPSGKYKMPDGSIVEKDKIRIKEPFIEYGPEDIPWLEYSGRITEDREMLFFVIEDAMFRMRYDPAPMIVPRSIYFTS